MDRPDISFETCQLSTKIKNATIHDHQANRIIHNIQQQPSVILFPSMDLTTFNLQHMQTLATTL